MRYVPVCETIISTSIFILSERHRMQVLYNYAVFQLEICEDPKRARKLLLKVVFVYVEGRI